MASPYYAEDVDFKLQTILFGSEAYVTSCVVGSETVFVRITITTRS